MLLCLGYVVNEIFGFGVDAVVKARVDAETDLFVGVMKRRWGEKVDLVKLTERVDWAKGWPDDPKAFWNVEAFMWRHAVNKLVRGRIEGLLKGFSGPVLDVGCGSVSYRKSVGFDISERMLSLNEMLSSFVVGDLNVRWPFDDGSFVTVTAVFVLNYVDFEHVVKEAKRVLREGGCFVVVQGDCVSRFHRSHEVNSFSKDWVRRLSDFFEVDYVFDEVHTLICRKILKG